MAFCLLLFLLAGAMEAEGIDLTGTWQSFYEYGLMEESMITTIQQVGDDIIGSFTARPKVGSERSGIIFGSVKGDSFKVNLLSVKESEGNSEIITITLIEGKVEDENNLKGNYYVHDSKGAILNGAYKAIRI